MLSSAVRLDQVNNGISIQLVGHKMHSRLRYRNERVGCGGGGSTGYGCSAGGDPSATAYSGASHAWSGADGGSRRRDTIPRAAGARPATGRATEAAYLRGRLELYRMLDVFLVEILAVER